MAKVKIGKFEVLAPLGRGAGSQILKIRRLADGKTYALKKICISEADDRKYYEQAEHEFEVATKFDNPRLEKMYFFEKQTRLFRLSGSHTLLEFIDGRPLASCKGLPLYRLVTIFFQVADGLTYMHDKGVFHADIKPENIMVTSTAAAKIIDFGLAWIKGDDKKRVQGTLEFLAPEQAKNRIVNAKTDIFNLGATMYRVLTTKPVPAQLRDNTLRRAGGIDQLVQPIATYNKEVPEDLDQLVRSCIRANPQERPESMKDLRNRLRVIAKRLRQESKETSEEEEE